jgi:2-haloacid dehalogenase
MVRVTTDTMDVVFDVGGVLIDWDPRHLYRKLLSDEAAVEWFLAEVCSLEWNREQDRGRPWAEAVAQLSARFPEHAELIAAYYARWDEMVPGPVAGTVGLLGELRAHGVPCYALTNFSAEMWARVRRRFGFLGWFDGIVVSGEEGLVKPDPRIYRVLLDRFRLDPATTLYVDDQVANVAAAEALGMAAHRFTSAPDLRARLMTHTLITESAQNYP